MKHGLSKSIYTFGRVAREDFVAPPQRNERLLDFHNNTPQKVAYRYLHHVTHTTTHHVVARAASLKSQFRQWHSPPLRPLLTSTRIQPSTP